jgi:hypothetical protein
MDSIECGHQCIDGCFRRGEGLLRRGRCGQGQGQRQRQHQAPKQGPEAEDVHGGYLAME